MNCSNDVFKLIFQYAFNTKMTHQEFIVDSRKVSIICENVPDQFLTPCVWCENSKTFVPNPFRAFFPYHPTEHLARTQVFNNLLICLGHTLTKEYFYSNQSYKQVFLRHARLVAQGSLHSWNFLCNRHWPCIRDSHMNICKENSNMFLRAIRHSGALPHLLQL